MTQLYLVSGAFDYQSPNERNRRQIRWRSSTSGSASQAPQMMRRMMQMSQ